jgi:hypothetical protein
VSTIQGNPSDTIRERIVGLGMIANWLDDHPDIPIAAMSFYGDGDIIGIYISTWSDTAREDFAAATRALADGAPKGAVTKGGDDNYLRVIRDFGATKLRIWTSRAVTEEGVTV